MPPDESRRKLEEIEHGRRIAGKADRVWQRDTVAGRKRVENRFANLCDFLGEGPRGDLLELGCGTGTWTQYLRKLSRRIKAIELSEDLIRVARAKINDPGVMFVAGDAEDLPFQEASFDVVCGLSILHHLNVGRVVGEVHRVLKPGGLFWFSEPNMMNPQILIQKNVPPIKRWLGDTPTETAFFRWGLARRFRQAGFRRVEVTPFDFLHPWIPDFAAGAAGAAGRVLERIPFVREVAGSLLIRGSK